MWLQVLYWVRWRVRCEGASQCLEAGSEHGTHLLSGKAWIASGPSLRRSGDRGDGWINDDDESVAAIG